MVALENGTPPCAIFRAEQELEKRLIVKRRPVPAGIVANLRLPIFGKPLCYK
jgi:hypothetical protein